MSLQEIYSSKLYKSSKNKDKIKAALEDPINKELVQQLQEYLDDETSSEKKPLVMKFYSKKDLGISDDESSEEESVETEDTENSENSENEQDVSSDKKDSSSENEKSENEEKDNSENEEKDNSKDESTEVEESIQLKGHSNKVLASETYTFDSLNTKAHLNTLSKDIIDEIKGTLNSRQDTCGVDRVVSKGNELWIYYNDKTNLNNIMSSAIELLEAMNYTYLNFNRLARSENAIVFEVTFFNSSPTLNSLNNLEVNNDKEK